MPHGQRVAPDGRGVGGTGGGGRRNLVGLVAGQRASGLSLIVVEGHPDRDLVALLARGQGVGGTRGAPDIRPRRDPLVGVADRRQPFVVGDVRGRRRQRPTHLRRIRNGRLALGGGVGGDHGGIVGDREIGETGDLVSSGVLQRVGAGHGLVVAELDGLVLRDHGRGLQRNQQAAKREGFERHDACNLEVGGGGGDGEGPGQGGRQELGNVEGLVERQPDRGAGCRHYRAFRARGGGVLPPASPPPCRSWWWGWYSPPSPSP